MGQALGVGELVQQGPTAETLPEDRTVREFCYTCRSKPCECCKPLTAEDLVRDALILAKALSEKPTVYAPSYFDWQASRR